MLRIYNIIGIGVGIGMWEAGAASGGFWVDCEKWATVLSAADLLGQWTETNMVDGLYASKSGFCRRHWRHSKTPEN